MQTAAAERTEKAQLLWLALWLWPWLLSCPAAEPAVPVHLLDGTFVRQWLVLGPFPSEQLDTDFLAASAVEAAVQPREGMSSTHRSCARTPNCPEVSGIPEQQENT
jgi:hypothetical protein